MTVVLYRPNLDPRSGAGQLLTMQWRGLVAAGVPTLLACDRGALKFWLRTGVRARQRSTAEIERRFRDAAYELARQREYDHVVINETDLIELTAQRIDDIIAAEHERYPDRRIVV